MAGKGLFKNYIKHLWYQEPCGLWPQESWRPLAANRGFCDFNDVVAFGHNQLWQPPAAKFHLWFQAAGPAECEVVFEQPGLSQWSGSWMMPWAAVMTILMPWQAVAAWPSPAHPGTPQAYWWLLLLACSVLMQGPTDPNNGLILFKLCN